MNRQKGLIWIVTVVIGTSILMVVWGSLLATSKVSAGNMSVDERLTIGTPASQMSLALPAVRQDGRQVIKSGELELMVVDTDTAVANALALADTFGGYIINQRVWNDQTGFRFATITFGLPVAEFENMLRAFKTLGTILNESATGQDVTDERVDLNSRLANLDETQTRLRSFLAQATNVTETLQVHQQLVQIEGEIGSVQGRRDFLTNRAAAATITLQLTPLIPTPTATSTATPTPTPTPTPLPTAEVWRPGDTAQVAAVRLQDTAQNTADFFIFRAIVCLPWLLLLLLISYPIRRIGRRWRGR